MVVAGLRFDTRDGLTARTGPRWHADMPRNPGRCFTAAPPRRALSRHRLAKATGSAADVEADQLRDRGDAWS